MSLEAKVEAKLASLESLDHKGLSKAWEKALGAPPPKASSRKYLLRALSYQYQTKHMSSLTKAEAKALRSYISGDKAVPAKTKVSLEPGAKLIREWNGRTYTVSVKEEGFVHKDKVWKSLSAIAKDITGAHWSGPRFFGVRGL